MAKATTIPSKTGTITVMGHETLATNYHKFKEFTALLKDTQLDPMKDELRTLANEALQAAAPGATRVEIMGKKDATVLVSAPDMDKESSRLLVSDKKQRDLDKQSAFEAVASVLGEDPTEDKEMVVLTGRWVKWFSDAIEGYKQGGVKIPEPENFILKTEKRLTLDACQKLGNIMRDAEATEQQKTAAGLILDTCVKDLTVK